MFTPRRSPRSPRHRRDDGSFSRNAALLRPLPYPCRGDPDAAHGVHHGRITSGRGAARASRLKDRPCRSHTWRCPAGATTRSPDGRARRCPSSSPESTKDSFRSSIFRWRSAAALRPTISGRMVRPERSSRIACGAGAFGGDPGIVGKALTPDRQQPVVGVAAPDMDVPRGTDAWINVQLDPQSTNHGFDGYLRLRSSTPAGILSQRLVTVAAVLGHDFPGPEGNRAFIVEPFVDSIVGDLRPMLIIVLSATALLLVLACVNVANLLLARASRRSREIAIRAAVGASRGRIAAQLLTESAVLASTGMIVGVALACRRPRAVALWRLATAAPRHGAVRRAGAVLCDGHGGDLRAGDRPGADTATGGTRCDGAVAARERTGRRRRALDASRAADDDRGRGRGRRHDRRGHGAAGAKLPEPAARRSRLRQPRPLDVRPLDDGLALSSSQRESRLDGDPVHEHPGHSRRDRRRRSSDFHGESGHGC